MTIPYYQVDAFTGKVFGGNPAGVCPLESWLADDLMQIIARENNLAETAFFTPQDGGYGLRWFTPEVEVDLCGHATIASAHILFTELNFSDAAVRFHTRSGWLTATRRDQRIELDFPTRRGVACPKQEMLGRGLGAEPKEVLKARDYLAVFETPEQVAALRPDFAVLAQLDAMGVIATAPGRDEDFVSRFFAPKVGIPEDPATGSSHSTLIPYWADRLGKTELFGRQISRRGGEMWCRLLGERVGIAGQAATYARGRLEIGK